MNADSSTPTFSANQHRRLYLDGRRVDLQHLQSILPARKIWRDDRLTSTCAGGL